MKLLKALMILALLCTGCVVDNPGENTDPQGDDECTPGESFNDGCNECECPASGIRSEALLCTDRVCNPQPLPDDRCVPPTFAMECNECLCPESGLRSEAACSELDCGPVISRQPMRTGNKLYSR